MARIWLVDTLAALFAIGSWLCVHGLWVELPLLVQQLPEGWTLPSYLSVVICVSNVAPIAYSTLNHYCPRVVTDKRGIYVTVVVGVVSTFLIANFWKETSFLWGAERSTALLCLVFFFGMVDCSSRVLYVPFMSNFQDTYLTSFFIGEGLSSLIPSVFALAQGVGGVPECVLVNTTSTGHENATALGKYEAVTPPPRFSVEIFFYIILGVVLLSAVAFHLLNYGMVTKGALSTAEMDAGNEKSAAGHVDDGQEANQEAPSLFLYAVVVQVVVCFISNGILLSIQSFSSLPYGNSPFHLVVTLTTMVNPIACLLFYVLPPPTRRAINISCLLVTPLTCYVLATAVLSPDPPLRGTTAGEALIVSIWVTLTALYMYIKVALATLLRGSEGKRGLFWFGASTQIGSATGGVLSFIIINFTNVFHSINQCETLNSAQNIHK